MYVSSSGWFPEPPRTVRIFSVLNFTAGYLVMLAVVWSLGGRLNAVFRLTGGNVTASYLLSIYLLLSVTVWL